MRTCHAIRDWLDPASFNILLAEHQTLEQRQRLLGFLERGGGLQHRLGLAVMGNEQGLALLGQWRQGFGGIGREVGDDMSCHPTEVDPLSPATARGRARKLALSPNSRQKKARRPAGPFCLVVEQGTEPASHFRNR